jgi:hypothetical protein
MSRFIHPTPRVPVCATGGASGILRTLWTTRRETSVGVASLNGKPAAIVAVAADDPAGCRPFRQGRIMWLASAGMR